MKIISMKIDFSRVFKSYFAWCVYRATFTCEACVMMGLQTKENIMRFLSHKKARQKQNSKIRL